MSVLVQLYHKLKEIDDHYRDRRVDNLPFANNPLHMIVVIALYYGFVMHLGPKLMRNRQPFELKWIMLSYNALQMVVNLFLAVQGFGLMGLMLQLKIISVCMVPIVEPQSTGTIELRLIYLYMLLKFVDLLDTVFFVLRKRDKQITFLHVYHHMLMAGGTYMFVRYLPGGHVNFVGLLNTCVHTIMYFYYFISALRPELKQSLWWKKHITQTQIAQFMILFVYTTLAFFINECRYPKVILVFILMQDIVMLSLFGNFYYRTYVLKSKQTTQTKAKANVTCVSMRKKMKEN